MSKSAKDMARLHECSLRTVGARPLLEANAISNKLFEWIGRHMHAAPSLQAQGLPLNGSVQRKGHKDSSRRQFTEPLKIAIVREC